MKSQNNRFMTWRDMIISPAVELFILGVSVLFTYALHRRIHHLGFADCLIIFFIAQTICTLIVLKIVRTIAPLKEGTFYSDDKDQTVLYSWKLQGILCITNLSFQYISGLIPPIFRKAFYQMLGAQIGGGVVSIGGRLAEPSLVTIGENVVIGDDAAITPHILSSGPSNEVLILAKVRIERGAVIGFKSCILPGVTVGENAMVMAMALVTMNTQIPPGEIWGGIPARKIGEVKS